MRVCPMLLLLLASRLCAFVPCWSKSSSFVSLWHWHSPWLAVVVSLCFVISLSLSILLLLFCIVSLRTRSLCFLISLSISMSLLLFCIVSLRTRWEVEHGQQKVEELSGAVDNEASRLRLQYSCIIFSDLPGIHISRPACARAHAKGTK